MEIPQYFDFILFSFYIFFHYRGENKGYIKNTRNSSDNCFCTFFWVSYFSTKSCFYVAFYINVLQTDLICLDVITQYLSEYQLFGSLCDPAPSTDIKLLFVFTASLIEQPTWKLLIDKCNKIPIREYFIMLLTLIQM